MNECLKQLNHWMDPEKKFEFVSIHRFALYLGIRQAAVEDLVNSKRIDSAVVGGRTWIPLSFYYSHIWDYESDLDDNAPSQVNWRSATEIPEK